MKRLFGEIVDSDNRVFEREENLRTNIPFFDEDDAMVFLELKGGQFAEAMTLEIPFGRIFVHEGIVFVLGLIVVFAIIIDTKRILMSCWY